MNAIHMLPEPLYLATPYTKFFKGWCGSYIESSKLAARITRKYKVRVFTPIGHCHGMTTHGELPPVDPAFWRWFNEPFIEVCGGCLVAKMDGWESSAGIKDEINDFRAAKKTVLFIEPDSLEIGLT